MSDPIRVLVVGMGNIGESVVKILSQKSEQSSGFKLEGIVSRRPEAVIKQVSKMGLSVPVYNLAKPQIYLEYDADVAIMCGGSKNDLPVQTPFFARHFPAVVDSFDTHGHIGPYVDAETGQPMLGHFEMVDLICRATQHTAHIGIGWDPGSFSMMRAFFTACLGNCTVHAFYGLTEKGGLSMGHTNAIKGIPGVVDARQYTHAKLETIERLRKGDRSVLSDRDKHWRECKVVPAAGADLKAIEKAIVEMPLYFSPYDTAVKFVSQEELDAEKADFSHDGLVIAYGSAGYMEFKNVWNSNPLGTAGFLLAYARATYRANEAGRYGCFTALDTPVSLLLKDPENKISLV